MDAATQMAADGLQAFGMIGTVLWTMLRIGAVAMAMPMVGTRAVPARGARRAGRDPGHRAGAAAAAGTGMDGL
ncbi:flagellar biosynthetic protein FliR [Stenotrophomonas maltophilia]|nr:flagellar biosynthetic protein FliR [Stenotrophomonas maltophilia]